MRPLALLASLLLAACQPSVVFDTEVKGSSVIQGSPLGGLLGAFPQMGGFTNVNLSSSQEFANQGVRKEDVRSVKVKSFVIQITSPDSQDYAWLSSLAFFLEAAGQARSRLAHREAIETLGLKAPKPTLVMELDGLEMKPYVIADSMKIVSDASGRAPSNDVTLEARLVLTIDAFVFR